MGAQWGDSQKNSEDDVHRFAQCARLVEDTFVNNVDGMEAAPLGLSASFLR